MANRLYIGARYIPLPFNNPDGSYNWLPGVAYEGLTIVIYDHRSFISKKPVPAISTPPSEDTEHWVDAYLYNADVAEALLSINELQETKADKDGVYASLWAGELISKDRQTDNTPYLLRETGGDLKRIAPLCYPTLVGASVAENQLLPQRSSTVTNNGVTVTTADTGLITISGTSDKESGYINFFMSGFGVRFAKNHVYAFNVITVQDKGTTPINEFLFYGGGVTYSTNKQDSIQKITTDVTDNSAFYLRVNYAFNGTFAFYLNIIDLTLLFGSSIADYVYSLEQETAGSGIAKLRSWGFLRGYQAHNAGSIESVEVTGKKVVGFNQWNEEWESGQYNLTTGAKASRADAIRCKNPIPVKPNTSYYFGCTSHTSTGDGVWLWYAQDGTLINYVTNKLNREQTSPSNAYFMTFYIAPETTYNHDICINLSSDRNGEYEPYTEQEYDYGDDTLNGIFKLDANNNLYTDGDVKTSDGTITRYYGTRAYQSGDESLADAITDGTTTVYKLTTPTTEQGDPFPSPQIVYPDGTEEFITENGVPVGHETSYPYDLIGLVENLINVPDVPSTNGTYKLQAVRTSSGVTYDWVTD